MDKTQHTLPLARSARSGGSAGSLPELGGRHTSRPPSVPLTVTKAQGPRQGRVAAAPPHPLGFDMRGKTGLKEGLVEHHPSLGLEDTVDAGEVISMYG